MKAFKVNLVGSNNHYLVTETQKKIIEKMLNGEKRSAVINLGEDIIRLSTIKSLTLTSVDLNSCPDYFIAAVKREKGDEDDQKLPSYRKLPTKWIIVNPADKIIVEDISDEAIKRANQITLALGDPAEDKLRRFIIAKAHYLVGKDGIRQYYTSLNQLPEALVCLPQNEQPDKPVIEQIYRYGYPQRNKGRS
ncbi:hypothetical protein IJH89_01305 [Candidatus Saccharibacteria bacterium]|nr:hypothetical protein [Candidatus Saccharibacteria bacterium]